MGRRATQGLRYAGDHIRSVTWVTDYHGEENNAQKPDHIYVRYHWHEFVETDTAFGLDFLLIVSTVVAWACAVLVVCNFDRVKKSAIKAL